MLNAVSPSAVSLAAAPPLTAPHDSAGVAELRRRIHALERAGHGNRTSGGVARALPFGAPEIDDALPWRGLASGALHEISGPARDAAALGFVSALLARLVARAPGAVLWCRRLGASHEVGDIYAPGLAAFGLDPSRLILLGAKRGQDVLWAMREGLSCPRLLAVVGELEEAALGLTASRRLQLAAEKSGVSCFLLRTTPPRGGPANVTLESGPGDAAEPSAALSRWRLRAAPSGPVPGLEGAPAEKRWLGPGRLRWRAELWRCRGAACAEWLVEWHHETGNFTVVAPLCDRSLEPAAACLAL